jgi:hypothetical protein
MERLQHESLKFIIYFNIISRTSERQNPTRAVFVSNVCHFGNCREQRTLICNQRNGMAFLVGGRGQQMNECLNDTSSAASRCAFCGKHLPIVNGELQPWRAPSGEFFCNEFCADDAEEVRFRRHGKAERKAHQRNFFF